VRVTPAAAFTDPPQILALSDRQTVHKLLGRAQ
jgi:hypothetical protein